MSRRALALALVLATFASCGLAACNPGTKPAIGQEGSSTPATTSATAPNASLAPPTSSSAPAVPRKPGEGIKVVNAPADGDAISTIRTARLQAKAEGRVLVVYVSATWCEPCRRMKDEIHAGRLDDALGKTTLLAFDADKDGDRLASAGYKFSFIPFVALPSADGHPADSLEAKGKGSNAWRELLGKLEEWQKRTSP
ncbi:MAG: thioredoxin family protein [Deltaproteobacteria bacterium]|nr:thioredoxin family protein [Deltaproteobacteria bacterium]